MRYEHVSPFEYIFKCYYCKYYKYNDDILEELTYTYYDQNMDDICMDVTYKYISIDNDAQFLRYQ